MRSSGFALVWMLIIVLVGLMLFVFAGCGSKIQDVQYDDGGVVVVGYNCEGYIENKSDSPVRVRCVVVSGNLGEVTQWVKLLEPGNEHRIKQYIQMSDFLQAFYVYNMEGVLIGFVKPRKYG
jgi:hypothetical protein